MENRDNVDYTNENPYCWKSNKFPLVASFSLLVCSWGVLSYLACSDLESKNKNGQKKYFCFDVEDENLKRNRWGLEEIFEIPQEYNERDLIQGYKIKFRDN